MKSGADVLGEEHVAGDDRLLGDGRPPDQPEFTGEGALVELGTHGQAGLLGMLGNYSAEGLHVLEGPAHQQGVVHTVPVIGEHPHLRAGLSHGADLREPLPREASRHRPDGPNSHVAVPLPEGLHLLDDTGGVLHGHRVGHREHGRVSTRRGCT